MFCSISGKPPKDPVLSLSSNCIFERTLIEQYIEEHGRDPISNKEITKDELVEIAKNPKHHAYINSLNSSTLSSNYSIPNLLSSLRNEWDAIMIENFQLRKQLDGLSKQLSHALYEKDAARLVAANAMKEKDELSAALVALTKEIGGNDDLLTSSKTTGLNENLDGSDVKMNEENNFETGKIDLAVLKAEADEYVKLTKPFRRGKPTENLGEVKFQHKFKLRNDMALICCQRYMVKPANRCFTLITENNRLLRVDGSSAIYDHKSEIEIDTELVIPYNDSILIFSTPDGSHGVYNINERNSLYNVVSLTHKLCFLYKHEHILPENYFWVDICGSFGFASMAGQRNDTIYESTDEPNEALRATLHKDGLLLAIYDTKEVVVRDISKPHEVAARFRIGEELEDNLGKVTGVSFSPNGYWFFLTTSYGIITYDLRKDISKIEVSILRFKHLESLAMDTDITGNVLHVLESGNETTSIHTYKFSKANLEWIQITSLRLENDEELRNNKSKQLCVISGPGLRTSISVLTCGQLYIYG